MPGKAVTDDQMTLLNTGDDIIATAKQLLPFGSGNQQAADQMFPLGENRVLTGLAYSFYNHAKPRHTALAAVTAGAGNCDHFGAIAYVMCRERLPAQFRVAWVTGPGHSFAIVGKSGWNIGQCVAVDPWPIQAQAVLFEDHFMSGSTLNHLAEKDCKGQAFNSAKYQAFVGAVRVQRNAIEQSNWTNNVPPSGHTYDHQYCTANGSYMNYYVPMDVS
ncbi:hypothetical protein [Paraburkholderia silvatlantica]|uniref:Transglutaminase-like domain-containing protein n=1 Tax=Paraburkholderia silvatlantica TaxID=321895 RepID=A0ABR6FF80_9BURK|nr:hypothetical protein [Paraburkholderia silvatlantica]MBB2925783.1 hypothetical protein [Paraburkholderia silvatlantica]PVY33101.1 hypothetical protein C7411_10925 [Paraburkholderia silvatlantica]PXW37993.1 hypothetical protein C7413_10925 [Paraburkholderia silvatlantica]TDQ92522.1 hypothetical protein C7412_11125 [Paraburkholderia silvatlantica]